MIRCRSRHPVSRLRPGADQLRADCHSMVCARLYRRHSAGLALRAHADPTGEAVGRAGAADRRRLRRLRAVGDAGHHPRRPRSAMCCSTTCPYFVENPLEVFQLWKGGMSFHGGFIGCLLVIVLFARFRQISFLSLGDLTCAAATIGLFLGRIANFINGELWGRPTDVPWAMVFPERRAGAAASRASSTRRRSKGSCCSSCCASDSRRRAQAARPHHRQRSRSATASRARSASSSASRIAQLGFLWGGLTMGILLSVPLMLTGIGFIARGDAKQAGCGRPDGRGNVTARSGDSPAHRAGTARCRSRSTWNCA